MNRRPARGDKREIREKTRLVRPPRLEGVVKNRGLREVKKPKAVRPPKTLTHKAQGPSARERKAYHLKTRKSK